MMDLHDQRQVEELRRRLRLDPYHLRRLRHALLQEARADDESLDYLPESMRNEFRVAVLFHPLRCVLRSRSAVDAATKWLFETATGARLESVLLETPTGRVSLCLSSQVGCRAGCRFCATGQMPSVENLTSGEILDQLVQVNRHLRMESGTARHPRRVHNVVFMGMGEPLHNEDAVAETLAALEARDGFAMSLRRVIVSTVGVPDAMARIAARFPRVRLALSLHSATAETRQRLIPLARKHSLDELRQAALDVHRIQRAPIMIQYLMIEGQTDGHDELDALLRWLDGIDCHVNLIPFNPAPELPAWRPTPRAQRDAFAQQLRAAGYLTTIRYSQGADVEAACGQLAAPRD